MPEEFVYMCSKTTMTTYAYDGWGNLIETAYSDDTPTVTLFYDALGRQVEAHDAAGVTTFAYDAYGANTNETVIGVAGTNVIERFTDQYGRDAGYALNGERRSVIGRDPATGRIETMLTAGCANAFLWTYYPGSDLKRTLRYPNGSLVTWEYEPCRNLVTIVSNDVYSTFRYTYDEAGKRVSKNDERYVYNIRGELILATNIATGAEFAYRYDDIGNRIWSRELGTNCTYVANELNQYTNIVRGGSFEFSAFDLDGNQTNVVSSTGEWAVEYNGENRPVRWSRATDGIEIRMTYDRDGRRVEKNDETFVYDNYQDVAKTIWDPTEPVATRPLVYIDSQSDVLYFHDANKNVVDIIMHDEKLSYAYAPFGMSVRVEQTEVMTFSNIWKFSSEYADDEMGMVNYVFRDYSTRTGRWMSEDPAAGFAGINLYDYCKNAPTQCFDALGLVEIRIVDVEDIEKDVRDEEDVGVREKPLPIHGEFYVGDMIFRKRGNTRCCIEVLIPVGINVRQGIEESFPCKSRAEYVDHYVWLNRDYDWIAAGGRGYGHTRGMVVAHERGHAAAFFEIIAPWMLEEVPRYLDSVSCDRVRENTEELFELIMHQRFYAQRSVDLANQATHEWFVKNGYVRVNDSRGVVTYEKK